MIELKDVVKTNGFKIVSAGAFIAQHAIFPKVVMSRPDDKKEFANKSKSIINSITDTGTLSEINVKGSRPYKVPGKMPLKPTGDKKCNKCGTYVKLCPTQVIPANTPRKTIKINALLVVGALLFVRKKPVTSEEYYLNLQERYLEKPIQHIKSLR